jgi:hypothetical protein
MKLAIMQPYFLPYIGYFQLINAVDKFVIYDNIQYTKKGWINRNRILHNGKEAFITLPLAKASDFLDVNERVFAENFKLEMEKQHRKIIDAYRKSPFFNEGMELYNQIVNCETSNLFTFLYHSVQRVCDYLGISTEIIVSSAITVTQDLQGTERILGICKALNANTYINPIGGTGLYDRKIFDDYQINLYFLKSNDLDYKQFGSNFIPWLSILDVIMFVGKNTTKFYLTRYKLLNGDSK